MLSYQLKHGESNKKAKFRAQLQAVGKLKKHVTDDKPEVDDSPEVLSHAYWLWEGFVNLSTQRGFNQIGPQPLSISCIEAWARMHDIDKYDQPWFSQTVLVLDRLYMDHTYTELKKERDKQSSKNRPSTATSRSGRRR